MDGKRLDAIMEGIKIQWSKMKHNKTSIPLFRYVTME